NGGDINLTYTFAGFENLTGGISTDSFTFTNAGSVSGAVDGAAGDDTLVGDDDGNIFTITDANTGTLTGKTSGWSNIENLSGGAGVDSFTITGTGEITGDLDAAAGTDTLDYSALAGPVSVNLQTGVASRIGGEFFNIEDFIGSTGSDT